MQITYNPVDYKFQWTEDWYEWDRAAAVKMALQARNAKAKQLRQEGMTVRVFTLKDQLISRGGIGSGKPHLDFCVSVYGLNVWQI